MNASTQDEPIRDIDVQPGDRVILRKPHPCGGTEWEVSRTGADIGLRCLQCNHTIMLPRHEFRTKLRSITRKRE